MATIGLLSVIDPVEPKKPAFPKAKMPPSEATSQYPPLSGVAAMPTIGLLSLIDPVEPKNAAPAPKLQMPPAEAPSQQPAEWTPRPTSRPVCVPLGALLGETMDAVRAPSRLGQKATPTVPKRPGAP